MKVLVFPDIPKYEMTYEGLLVGATKGAETRTLSKVLTKLEEVGTKKIGKDGQESLFYTAATIPVVFLEDSELEFVKRKLSEVEWNGIGAKEAGRLLEWIDEKHPSEEEYRKSKIKPDEAKKEGA